MIPHKLTLLIWISLLDLHSLLKLSPIIATFAKSSSSTRTQLSATAGSSLLSSPPYDLIVKGDIVRLTLGQRIAFPGDYLVHEQYGLGQYIGIRHVDLTPARPNPTYEPVVVVKYNDGEGVWFKRLVDRELYIYRSFSTVSGHLQDDNDIDMLATTPSSLPSSLVSTESAAVSSTSTTRKSKKKLSITASDITTTDISSSQASFSSSSSSGYNQEISLLSSLCDSKKWRKRLNQVKLTSKSTAINLIKLVTIRNNFHRVPCTDLSAGKYNLFRANFQFTPTVDQIKCFEAIQQDLVFASKPMDRLICGDVGFGKTEVAMHAMYIVVNSRRQVAVLAPTRVLALQHLRSIQDRMPGVKTMLLRGGGGSGSASRSQEVKDAVASGECQIVVGTHALLQSDVVFNRLGLLVIDEEQRFGVGHKEKLKVVSSGLDVLTLSATPIPRTLGMAVSGLRDMSLMTAPPLGRKEVKVYVDVWNVKLVREAIVQELSRDGQVFIVVPFIKDCEEITLKVKAMAIPEAKLLEAHGRLEDLEERIDRFRYKEANILIATTVIENGVDMPNVNTIIVYCADRFGMSALYQLRGRVGRCDKQAYAYFLTNTTRMTIDAENRLTYLKTFTALGSGYELSMRDMDMRGSGSLFGEQQSGNSDIGIDLQTRLMSEALNNLKTDVLLPVTDTRVTLCLPTAVEQSRWTNARYLSTQESWLLKPAADQDSQPREGGTSSGKSLQELTEWDLNRVSVWEDESIARVLNQVFSSSAANSGICLTDTGPVEPSTAATSSNEGSKPVKRKKSTTASTSSSSSSSSVSSAATVSVASAVASSGTGRRSEPAAPLNRLLTAILTAASSNDFKNIYKMCREQWISSLPAATTTTAAAAAAAAAVDVSNSSDAMLPLILVEMLQRTELRMLCRKLGITDLLFAITLASVPIPAKSGASNGDAAAAVATIYKLFNPYENAAAAAPTTVLCIAAGLSASKWNSLKAGIPLELQSRVSHSSQLYVNAATRTVVSHHVPHLALSLPLLGETPTTTTGALANDSTTTSSSHQVFHILKQLLTGLNEELVAVFDKAVADCAYEKPADSKKEKKFQHRAAKQ